MTKIIKLRTKVRAFYKAYQDDKCIEKFLFRCVAYYRNDCDHRYMIEDLREDIEVLGFTKKFDKACDTISWNATFFWEASDIESDN